MKKQPLIISVALIAAIFTFSCKNVSSEKNSNSYSCEINDESDEEVVAVEPIAKEEDADFENREQDGLDGTTWSAIDGPKVLFRKGKAAFYLEGNWGTPMVAEYEINNKGHVIWDNGEFRWLFNPTTGDFVYGRVDDVAPSVAKLEKI